MPLNLVDRSTNANWLTHIERERSARLKLRRACRPVPTAKYVPLGSEWVLPDRSRPSTGLLLRSDNKEDAPPARADRTASSLLQSSHTQSAPSLPSHWAGHPLEHHPSMVDSLLKQHWKPVTTLKKPGPRFAMTSTSEALSMGASQGLSTGAWPVPSGDTLASTDSALVAAITAGGTSGPGGLDDVLQGLDTAAEGMAPFAGGGRSMLESRSRRKPSYSMGATTGSIGFRLPGHMTAHPPTGQWLL
mmetsp:Transcript_46627/g.120738  ORF Transcript_46627/g.120738 Transcript_46627/m.120738 type:complete len:246 (-) Transcript_46627:199-936(-)